MPPFHIRHAGAARHMRAERQRCEAMVGALVTLCQGSAQNARAARPSWVRCLRQASVGPIGIVCARNVRAALRQGCEAEVGAPLAWDKPLKIGAFDHVQRHRARQLELRSPKTGRH